MIIKVKNRWEVLIAFALTIIIMEQVFNHEITTVKLLITMWICFLMIKLEAIEE